MGYVPLTWTALTPLNAVNLGHAGDQYAEMIAYLTGHNHDDDFYSRAYMESTFLHAGNDGHGSGANAETVDGYTLDQLRGSIPQNLIVWWFGDIEELDAGWGLADGNSGTRNLVGRYVIGAGDDDVGEIGGSPETFTPTGSINVAGNAVTVSEMASHYHGYSDSCVGGGGVAMAGGSTGDATAYGESKTTGGQGGSQPHGHPGSSIAINQIDKRPKTKYVYLIQKL